MSRQKVKVVVRVRPQLCEEENTWVQVTSDKNLQTLNHRNLGETLQYEFERVFDPGSSQLSVYNNCVKPLLAHTLQGQNASVFAYGPTGAGKTHTILGTGSDPGVIPRCVKDVLGLVNEERRRVGGTEAAADFQVSFSYLEIYQEKVFDLLEPKPVDLPIREDQFKNIFVTGLCEHKIETVQDFNQRFAPASKNRTTAATKLNERSSRSHSLLMLKILKTQPPFRKFSGKLYIIDLAGSEDNRKTGNQGVRLKESGAINSSLLALGQVVDALNKGQNCVPYRSSKLTRILQDSLGGNSHACMIVNLAPEEKCYFDTYTTLLFARKTKKIVNTVSTNEIKEAKPKEKSLKRSHSSDSKEKKRKTAESSSPSLEEVTPTKRPRTEVEPKQILSPLIRHQERFKSELRQEMFSRLELLETRLLGQMKTEGGVGESEGDSMLPDSTTSEEEGKSAQLTEAMDKLNSLLGRIEEFKSAKGDLAKDERLKENSKEGCSSQGSMKQETSAETSAVCKKGKVYSDGSSNKFALSDLSNSPLFFKPPALKRKGFKSSAAKEVTDEKHEAGNTDDKPISGAQRNHNERILNILNSGTVKELLDLQTVGAKRAKLIHSWREIHGPFSMFDDLTSVPGLTSKYLQSFLKSNLVQE